MCFPCVLLSEQRENDACRRPLPIAFECLHHTPQKAVALLPVSVSFDPLKWHSADFSFRHREAADVVPLANDSIAGGKSGCLGWL